MHQLQRIDVQRTEVDPEQYRDRYADEADAPRIIEGPCRVHVDGSDVPSLVYVPFEPRRPGILPELKKLRFTEAQRTLGLMTSSKMFGYAPRNVFKGDEACHTSLLSTTHPKLDAALCEIGADLERIYRELEPDRHAEHAGATAAIKPEWRMGQGVFTSGNINSRSQLPYHYDKGNAEGVWSNMLTLKRACHGGDLAMPELGITVRLADWSVLMFDGQTILHGVTPFNMTKPDGHRFTLVYYTLTQMWACLPPTEEIARAARNRAMRERGRVV